MPQRDQVFISYSHDDRRWLDELLTHLQALRTVELSWDGLIEPGQRWRQEIQKYLDTARVAVLLVSPQFLVSEFIFNVELPQILRAVDAKEVALLWCHVKPCLYQESPIWEFQAAHNPEKAWSELDTAKRDRLLVEIAAKVKRACESRQPVPARPAKEEFAEQQRQAPKELKAEKIPPEERTRLVRRLADEAATNGGKPAAGDEDPFRRARLILKDVEDPHLAAEVGSLFVLKRDWPNALYAYDRMVEISTPGDKLSMAVGYEHLGFVYERLELAAHARECWQLSAHVYRTIDRAEKAREVAKRLAG